MPDPRQYDRIGHSYGQIQRSSAHRLITARLDYTIGRTPQQSVLDLACGTGQWAAHALDTWGAAAAVGVDVSEAMLAIARDNNLQRPSKPVTYILADLTQPLILPPQHAGPFDLVLGIWMLNYAMDEAELTTMFANILKYLKPGGRFVGVVPAPDEFVLPETLGEEIDVYGVAWSRVRDLQDGFVAKLRFLGSDPPVEFQNVFLKREIYMRAAEAAGMLDFEIERPYVPDALLNEDGEDYWAEYYRRPWMTVVKGSKT